MTREAIVSDKLTRAAGPFSPAIRSSGLIYLSGQVGQDPETGLVVEGDVITETIQLFANVDVILEAAGKTFSDVLRVAVYLTDMGDFAQVNEIYAKYFTAPFPARTCIAVAGLPLGAKIEIDMILEP